MATIVIARPISSSERSREDNKSTESDIFSFSGFEFLSGIAFRERFIGNRDTQGLTNWFPAISNLPNQQALCRYLLPDICYMRIKGSDRLLLPRKPIRIDTFVGIQHHIQPCSTGRTKVCRWILFY